MKSSRTLEDHIEFSQNFLKMESELKQILEPMMKKYRLNDKIYKLFEKINPSTPNSIWMELKSELDNDYHSIITDDDFLKHKHIYYNK